MGKILSKRVLKELQRTMKDRRLLLSEVCVTISKQALRSLNREDIKNNNLRFRKIPGRDLYGVV